MSCLSNTNKNLGILATIIQIFTAKSKSRHQDNKCISVNLVHKVSRSRNSSSNDNNLIYDTSKSRIIPYQSDVNRRQ